MKLSKGTRRPEDVPPVLVRRALAFSCVGASEPNPMAFNWVPSPALLSSDSLPNRATSPFPTRNASDRRTAASVRPPARVPLSAFEGILVRTRRSCIRSPFSPRNGDRPLHPSWNEERPLLVRTSHRSPFTFLQFTLRVPMGTEKERDVVPKGIPNVSRTVLIPFRDPVEPGSIEGSSSWTSRLLEGRWDPGELIDPSDRIASTIRENLPFHKEA